MLARSVADAACVAQALLPHPFDPGTGSDTRIGVVRGHEALAAPEIVAATRGACTLLASGNDMVEVDASNFDWGSARRAAYLLVLAAAARIYATHLDDRASGLSPALRSTLEFGRSADPGKMARATARVEEARTALQAMLALCDVLLLPSTPQTSFAFGSAVPPSQADFTAPANIAGLPAISVPARNGAALPIGVQLLAAHGDDALLLRLASRLG